MAAWVVWVLGGLLVICAEVLSGDLWLLMIGLGALTGAIPALLGAHVVVSALVFAVVSVALIGGIRPVLKRRLLAGHDIRTNVQALIGARATVVAPVDSDSGQVKIGGEIWSARTHHGGTFPPGTPVIVVEISGATAVVAAEP